MIRRDRCQLPPGWIIGWSVGLAYLVILSSACGGLFDQPEVGTVDAGQFFEPIGPVSLIRYARAEPSTESFFESGDSAPHTAVPSMPDSKIRLDLGMRLDEADIPVSDLAITVDDQRVILEGRTGTHRARDRVEVLVRSHEAVRDVVNRLEVDG